MVAVVPIGVVHFSIVCVILDDLLLGNLESRLVFKFSVCELKHLSCLAASKGSFSIITGYGWSHALEHHDIVFRHFARRNDWQFL